VNRTAAPVALLHGFGQGGRAFAQVIELLGGRLVAVAPDLPGHGSAPALAQGESAAFDEVAAYLLERLPQRFALGGYSLGGRIALWLALRSPERLERLILISTTAGIEDPRQRAARLAADREWASLLEREPLERFLRRWRSQPVFAGEPPQAAEAAMALARANDPRQLALVLRRLSSGAMEPLWGRLPQLRVPATVVVGSRDQKYRELGSRLAATLPNGRLVVVEGGHNLVLENPGALAELLVQGCAAGGSTPSPGPSGGRIAPSTTASCDHSP